MLNVKVKYFGPLIESDVSLHPLTVFIGQNNAGKSYMASLLYAILSSFKERNRLFRYRLPRRMNNRARIRTIPKNDRKFLENLYQQGSGIRFGDLPQYFKAAFDEEVNMFSNLLSERLTSEIQRCFGSRLSDLIRPRCRKRFELVIQNDNPVFRLAFNFSNERLALKEIQYSLDDFSFSLKNLRDVPDEIRFTFFIDYLIQECMPGFRSTAYYFPAARSGILQSHRALAGFMMSSSPLVGIETIEIPRLTAIVVDFISELLHLDGRTGRSRKLMNIATFIEQEISHGIIDVEKTNADVEYPEFVYESEGNRFPLHRTSSMISEIAPIVIFLKYIIRPGNVLIIEEPEAHLHPENQRVLARAISQMVHARLPVLLTTHSDYFLQQLSNFVRLSSNPQMAGELGYNSDERISPNSVGAYLFSFRKGRPGVTTEELLVSEDGIPEDTFVEIAEAIYNETVQLD